MKSSSNSTKLWTQIPDVAQGLSVRKWLRQACLKALSSVRFFPLADKEYVCEVEKLSPQERSQFFTALINTRNYYKANTDFYGIVGIPMFLGIFAFINIIDAGFALFIVYLALILFYAFLYFYSRMLQTVCDSCLEVASLHGMSK